MSGIEWIIWGVSACLIIAGLAGVFLPVLPGPFLIVAAALLHKIFLPQYLSWWTVAGIAIAALFCALMDWLCLALGIKLAGASKWSLIGACAGFLIGIFFHLPGIFLGTILGAILGEYLVAEKQLRQASVAGLAAGIGMIVATALRFLLTLFMILAFVLDCVVY